MRPFLTLLILSFSTLVSAQVIEEPMEMERPPKYLRGELDVSLNYSFNNFLYPHDGRGGFGFGGDIRVFIASEFSGPYIKIGFNRVQHNDWSFTSGVVGSGDLWENCQINAPYGHLGVGYRFELNNTTWLDLGIYAGYGKYYVEGDFSTYSGGQSSEPIYSETWGSNFDFVGANIAFSKNLSIKERPLKLSIGFDTGTLNSLFSDNYDYNKISPLPNFFLGLAIPFQVKL